MDGKTVYVNKTTRSENSAMDHATKRHPHVIGFFLHYCAFSCKVCSVTVLIFFLHYNISIFLHCYAVEKTVLVVR